MKVEQRGWLAKKQWRPIQRRRSQIQKYAVCRGYQEVPKEEAMRSYGALKKWHRAWHLAMGHPQKSKERTCRNCGSWKRLTVAGREMTWHPGVPWRKRNVIRRNWTRDKVEGGIRRLWMLRKRLQTCQEGRMRIKDLRSRRPLYLKKESTTANGIRGRSSRHTWEVEEDYKTLKKALHKIVSMRIVKQKAGSYVTSRKIKDWAWLRGRPPQKRLQCLLA
jgi:hypothetical protein